MSQIWAETILSFTVEPRIRPMMGAVLNGSQSL